MANEQFDDIDLKGLLGDIFRVTNEKREIIKGIIETLKSYLSEPGSIIIMAPIIKDYIDVLVKNDEHFIKIATIIQRLSTAEAYATGDGNGSMQLTEEERQRLLLLAQKELAEELKRLDPKKDEAMKLLN